MAFWNRDKVHFHHNPVLPQKPIRCLLIGSSGCGKTSLLAKLIIEDYFDFDRLVIASASIFQHEYQIIIESYKHGLKNKHIKALFQNQNEINDYKKAIPIIARELPDNDKSHIEVITYQNSDEIPPPDKLKKDGSKTLVILDDMLTKDQKPIAELFVYGRPCNLNVIYLSQSYFKLDRQTIRLNANFLIFFKLNKIDIQNIYDDLCSTDFPTFDQFRATVRDVFQTPYSFFTINIDETNINKKYLKNFESPLINIMNRITIDDYNTQLLKADKAEKDLMNRVKESRNVSSSFQFRQEEVLKPIIEPLKKIEKDFTSEIPKALSQSKALVKVNDEHEEKPIATDEVTQDEIIKMIKTGTDKVFGLVRYRDEDDDRIMYKFGIIEDFEKTKDSKNQLLYYYGDHEITFDVEVQFINAMRTTESSGAIEQKEYPLTKNVMLFLTRDLSETFVKGGQVDENAKVIYKDIVNFCIGRELAKIKKSKSPLRDSMLDIFRKNQKFKDLLSPLYMYKGEGYKTMAIKPIVISPNKSEQLNRLLVLLGAKQAGNTSQSAESEYNAILDEMFKSGQISKQYYKILYYKFKN